MIGNLKKHVWNCFRILYANNLNFALLYVVVVLCKGLAPKTICVSVWLPELSGEEWRHVPLQPIVHDDGEVAADHAVLVECFYVVAAPVLQRDVVDLHVLEVTLAIDVGVVCTEKINM